MRLPASGSTPSPSRSQPSTRRRRSPAGATPPASRRSNGTPIPHRRTSWWRPSPRATRRPRPSPGASAGTTWATSTINSTTGVLSFASRPNYEISTDRELPVLRGTTTVYTYEIIVKATDAAPDRNTRELPRQRRPSPTLTRRPRSTGPMDDDDFPETIYTSLTTPDVATFTARDEEDQDITWNLSGDDAGDFTITEGRRHCDGVVTFNNPPNHERPGRRRRRQHLRVHRGGVSTARTPEPGTTPSPSPTSTKRRSSLELSKRRSRWTSTTRQLMRMATRLPMTLRP